MQYFTERGDSHAEVLAKVRTKYGSGPDVLISNQRTVPVKSVWGKITGAKQWEISGAILDISWNIRRTDNNNLHIRMRGREY